MPSVTQLGSSVTQIHIQAFQLQNLHTHHTNSCKVARMEVCRRSLEGHGRLLWRTRGHKWVAREKAFRADAQRPLEGVDRLSDVATEASGTGTQRELRQEAWASWPCQEICIQPSTVGNQWACLVVSENRWSAAGPQSTQEGVCLSWLGDGRRAGKVMAVKSAVC